LKLRTQEGETEMILTKPQIDSDPNLSLFNGHIISRNQFAGQVGFTKPKLVRNIASDEWDFDIFDCWWQRAATVEEAENMIMTDCGIRRTHYTRR
jgi:hypothetical protein